MSFIFHHRAIATIEMVSSDGIISSRRVETKARGNFARTVFEVIAVVLNLGYTYFYLHNNPVCFWLGGIGSAIFVYLCLVKKLYAECILQLFYVGLAIYGFVNYGAEWVVSHKHFGFHMPFLLAGFLLVVAFGFLLKKHTDQKLPYIDAFTTVFGIIATWHMVNFLHENWLYWIVINSVSIFLYAKRTMYFGAFMFAVYLVMSVSGYFELGWF